MPKIFAALVVLLVAGFFIFAPNKNVIRRMTATAKPAPQATAIPIDEPEIDPNLNKKAEPVVPSGPVTIREGNANCNKSECRFNVTVEARALNNQVGDMAGIHFDLKRASKEPVALLSVEPLSKSLTGFPAKTKKVTLDEIYNGVSFYVALPNPGNKPVLFGVFLCKDAGQEGRCLGKSVVELGRVMSMDAQALSTNRTFLSPDLVYFFQYVTLDNGKFYALGGMRREELGDAAFEKRRLAQGDPVALSAQRAELETAKKITRVIRSLPLEFQDSTLGIVLPGRPPRK